MVSAPTHGSLRGRGSARHPTQPDLCHPSDSGASRLSLLSDTFLVSLLNPRFFPPVNSFHPDCKWPERLWGAAHSDGHRALSGLSSAFQTLSPPPFAPICPFTWWLSPMAQAGSHVRIHRGRAGLPTASCPHW